MLLSLHLLGLLSDGNIHSHLDHMQAIVFHAFQQAGVRHCYVHALLDGRDVGVQSALIYTEQFEKLFPELKEQRGDIDYALPCQWRWKRSGYYGPNVTGKK